MTTAPPELTPCVVLTRREAETVSGCDYRSLLAAAARGELQGVRRVGRKILFHRQKLLSWLSGDECHEATR